MPRPPPAARVGKANRCATSHRVAAGRTRGPRQTVRVVVDQRAVAHARMHCCHRRDQLVSDHRLGVDEPTDPIDPERRLHILGGHHRTAQTVDVVRPETRIAQCVDTRLGYEGPGRACAPVAGVRRTAETDDRNLIHGRVSTRARHRTSSKSARGARPSMSRQIIRTRSPTLISSGGVPTIVPDTRSPGCSSSSIATSGCPPW